MGEILDKLAEEIKKGRTKLQLIMKNIEGQLQDHDAMAAQAEHEIKKLEAQPQTKGRDHLIHVYRLRYHAAVRGRELLVAMMNVNVDEPNSEKNFTSRNSRLNTLKVQLSYLSTDFTIVNYRPIARAIRETLQGNGVPGTGPLQQAQGPLQQHNPTGPLQSRPGTGSLSQPRPGTGSLTPPGGGTGPLSQPRSGTGPLPQQRPGTGSLTPPGGGTGSLQQRTVPQAPASNPLQRLYAGLAEAVAQPDQRRILEQIAAAFDDVEATIAPMRGAQIGEMAMSEVEAGPLLTKVAGKVYYLNRAVQQLPPKVQALVAFESEQADPTVEEFKGKAAAGEDGKNPIASRLKSMFKLQ